MGYKYKHYTWKDCGDAAKVAAYRAGQIEAKRAIAEKHKAIVRYTSALADWRKINVLLTGALNAKDKAVIDSDKAEAALRRLRRLIPRALR
jgi:hypothetical protein